MSLNNKIVVNIVRRFTVVLFFTFLVSNKSMYAEDNVKAGGFLRRKEEKVHFYQINDQNCWMTY